MRARRGRQPAAQLSLFGHDSAGPAGPGPGGAPAEGATGIDAPASAARAAPGAKEEARDRGAAMADTHDAGAETTEARDAVESLRAFDPTFRVDADLIAGDEVDPGRAGDYLAELLHRYELSPEIASTPREHRHLAVAWVDAFLECALFELHASAAELEPTTVAELFLEIIPRDVKMPARHAAEAVELTRIFLRFLRREFGLENAGASLAVLDAELTRDFAAALETRQAARALGTAVAEQALRRLDGATAKQRRAREAALREAARSKRKASRKAKKKNR